MDKDRMVELLNKHQAVRSMAEMVGVFYITLRSHAEMDEDSAFELTRSWMEATIFRCSHEDEV